MISDRAVIHETARISPDADIAPGAFVGEGCIIGAGVRLGYNAVVEAHTEIGENTVLAPNAHVGGAPQDIGYKGEPTRLVIGKNCIIREFATIHRATTKEDLVTVVGDDCYIMCYAHIGHDCKVGNSVIMTAYAALAGHTKVGDFTVFGGHAGVHQFVRIGTGCMIGGMTKITQDVPPFCLAEGHPASVRGLNTIGLRRRGVDSAGRMQLKRAMKIYLDRGLSIEEAASAIRELGNEPEVVGFAEFLTDSKRSYTRR